MSADNWAVCPRCLNIAETTLKMCKTEIRGKYGKVSIEEWEEMAPLLAEDVDEEAVRTFREDYEFWGAETGRLEISYRGECTKCGLKYEYASAKPFWSPPAT